MWKRSPTQMLLLCTMLLSLCMHPSNARPNIVLPTDTYASESNSGNDSDRPWFCHGLDCPRYSVVDSCDAYETREYEEGVWATTSIEAYNYAMAVSIGFRRLFKYIDGANEDDVKIPMTAPVLADVTPSCGPFCKQTFNVSFFVPFHMQESPPTPRDKDIEVTCSPAFTAYVASAGGYKLDEFSLSKMAGELADALDADDKKFISDHFFIAGYDPPFRVTGRHTEVWFLADEDGGRDNVVVADSK